VVEEDTESRVSVFLGGEFKMMMMIENAIFFALTAEFTLSPLYLVPKTCVSCILHFFGCVP